MLLDLGIKVSIQIGYYLRQKEAERWGRKPMLALLAQDRLQEEVQ
jgi:hypothetical protein